MAGAVDSPPPVGSADAFWLAVFDNEELGQALIEAGTEIFFGAAFIFGPGEVALAVGAVMEDALSLPVVSWLARQAVAKENLIGVAIPTAGESLVVGELAELTLAGRIAAFLESLGMVTFTSAWYILGGPSPLNTTERDLATKVANRIIVQESPHGQIVAVYGNGWSIDP